jgi:hypothetical protein
MPDETVRYPVASEATSQKRRRAALNVRSRKEKTRFMMFEYTRRRGVHSPVTDAPTFRVGKLARAKTTDQTGADISHLIDRSYNYHSPRELHWHLAERLGLAPGAVMLRESAAA